MMSKTTILLNPCVKAKDRKPGDQLVEIPFDSFPGDVINLVLEFADAKSIGQSTEPEFTPPPDAIVKVLDLDGVLAVVTLIGHENQLLIRPTKDGFVVRHHNFRYSVNRLGVQYPYEAYS